MDVWHSAVVTIECIVSSLVGFASWDKRLHTLMTKRDPGRRKKKTIERCRSWRHCNGFWVGVTAKENYDLGQHNKRWCLQWAGIPSTCLKHGGTSINTSVLHMFSRRKTRWTNAASSVIWGEGTWHVYNTWTLADAEAKKLTNYNNTLQYPCWSYLCLCLARDRHLWKSWWQSWSFSLKTEQSGKSGQSGNDQRVRCISDSLHENLLNEGAELTLEKLLIYQGPSNL